MGDRPERCFDYAETRESFETGIGLAHETVDEPDADAAPHHVGDPRLGIGAGDDTPARYVLVQELVVARVVR